MNHLFRKATFTFGNVFFILDIVRQTIYLFLILLSNSYISAQGTWQTLPDFPGTSRYAATGFSINGKGYVITGYHGSGPILLKDTWEYDPATGAWTQKTDFPGSARWYASSFSINGKGYLGMGEYTHDFWEYDPIADSWIQKNDFPGASRAEGVGFSVGSKGYLGLGAPYGTSNFMSDFWEYEPSTDTWTQIQDFPGGPRGFAVSFVIGSKGYVGTGESPGYIHNKDLWEYDPSTGSWAAKQDMPLVRSAAVAYSLGGRGYIGMGQAPGAAVSFPTDNWRFDPLTNQWDSVAALPFFKWCLPVTFTINDSAYVATGFPAESKFWSYSENVSTTVNEPEKDNELIIRPNPFCGTFEINYSVTQKAFMLIRITDVMGQIIYSESIPEFSGDLKKSIDISDKSKGIYFIEVSDGTNKKIQKILSN